MYNIGLPIPPGFAITTFAFKEFLEATGLKEKIMKILKSTDVEDTNQLNEASEKIKELILKEKISDNLIKDIMESYDFMNISHAELKSKNLADIMQSNKKTQPFVAVRSSATAEDALEASF